MRMKKKSFSSTSSEISMLLGLQDFDFSTVTDDPCTARSNSKKTRVKVTSCGSGSFTCNDGQCVSINERCNQISNCRFYLLSQMCQKTFGHFARDESDEENCKMLVIKDNYNNKIAPFGYDYVEDVVIPVDVKVSIAIIDILSIQEVNLVYVLKFRFLMEWYDYR